jgi:hypothetical protein
MLAKMDREETQPLDAATTVEHAPEANAPELAIGYQ